MATNPKSLETVYSIRDIQNFGAGSRRMKEVDEANRNVTHASFWLTVHRQTIASFPNFFVYLARILILVCAGVLASRGINHPVGTIAISFAATAFRWNRSALRNCIRGLRFWSRTPICLMQRLPRILPLQNRMLPLKKSEQRQSAPVSRSLSRHCRRAIRPIWVR